MKRLLLFAVLLFAGTAQAQLYPTTKCVSVTPTIDTAIYATGDVMGSVYELEGALNANTRSGYVMSVILADKAAQSVSLEVIIWDEEPASSVGSDNAAFDPTDSDLAKIAGRVVFDGSNDRSAFSDNSLQYVSSKVIPVGGTSAATTSLWVNLVARGAYDGATTGDITIKLCVSQD